MDEDLDTGPDDFAPKPSPVDRDSEQLNVAELIHKLMAVEDKTTKVWANGCDCSNPVVDIYIYPESVTIDVSL